MGVQVINPPITSGSIAAALGFTPAATAISPIPVGSVAAPGAGFEGATDYGFSLTGGDTLNISAGGIAAASFTSTYISLPLPIGVDQASAVNLTLNGKLRMPTKIRQDAADIDSLFVLGAASRQIANHSAIEIDVQSTVATGGQQSVPIQIGIWNAVNAEVEPMCVFRSKGATVGSSGALVASDKIFILQASGDNGSGPSAPNTIAGQITFGVDASSTAVNNALAAGFMPGQFSLKISDTSGVVQPVFTVNSDQRFYLQGAFLLDNTFNVRATGQVLPSYTNLTTPGTNNMVISQVQAVGFSSTGVSRTVSTSQTKLNSATNGAETSSFLISTFTGGALTVQATFSGLLGLATFIGSIATASPRTVTTVSTSQTTADSSLIFNTSAGCTVTMLSASTHPGRHLRVKNITAQAIISASSNIVPIGSATAGTALLPATIGAWAFLQSDGSNWVVLESSA